ncbi:hypothetical protein [Streptomyces sp. NBC_00145]|uniref:hypothetical protein n=1 Tax=Streptomyces sp. NBC_00145 TaxID=2975666 RepID=UPI002E19E3F5
MRDSTARELGYPLQAHQQNKGRGRTRVIGLILQDIANPFYTEVSAGVIDAARARDYEVFLAHTQESGETLAKVVDTMITPCRRHRHHRSASGGR